MARVFNGERTFLDPVLGPVERLIYRLAAWTRSASSIGRRTRWPCCCSTWPGCCCSTGSQRLQHVLPLNPQGFGPVPPDLAFNTAVSFTTNTNWQTYAGESTMSYFTQMAGLALHNFVSAATGIAMAVALVRGFARQSAPDHRQLLGRPGALHAVRAAAHLAWCCALVLVWQGVPQNLKPYTVVATTLEGAHAD